MRSNDETRKWWPAEFVLTHMVKVGASLEMTLRLQNTGTSLFMFEEALHSYIVIGDVKQVHISGLENVDYLDKVRNKQKFNQGNEPIRFERKTDRIYLNTTHACTIDDPAMKRKIVVTKRNSNETVVWNPWIDKAKAMSDFGDDEWPGMVCVETCNVLPNPVELKSGATHEMTATISL